MAGSSCPVPLFAWSNAQSGNAGPSAYFDHPQNLVVLHRLRDRAGDGCHPSSQAADAGIAGGPTASYSIGFSNSYAGSDFRKVMVRNWQEIADQAQRMA